MSFDHIECLDGESADGTEDIQFTTFRETYKIVSFAMSVGMLYPDPKTAKKRLICIFHMLITVTPMSFTIILDIYYCWLRRDIINIIRHSTIVGPFLGIFFKMLIFFYKRNPAKQIIDEIDNDYAMYNRLPPSHKIVINSYLKINVLYSEMGWTFTVLCCVLSFPGTATILTVYNFLFKDEPMKFMVHDVNRPFAPPEARFESPFFELMFVYTCYCAMFYIINFVGFDGFFGLTINHACLKIEMYCKSFEDAMKAKDKSEIHKNLVGVIQKQNRMFKFVDWIQDAFNIWLGAVLITTMIQICNCMYHITEGAEMDARYVIYIIGVVIHIYLPCRYSSKLKHMFAATTTKLYCGGWERTHDARTRRTTLIMMARGHVPLEITAFNLLVFDMDLFVALLKTSYSMYTLLQS